MQLQLVFADSEVSRVEVDAHTLRIVFPAASVTRGASSLRPQPGTARGVELLLTGVRLAAPPSDCFGRLAQGRVAIDGRWSAQLALPSQHTGACRLELAFANGSRLDLLGDALACRFVAGANFHDTLAC